MKKTYMPSQEIEKLIWLKNFANKLSTYATKYNITVAEITDMQNSAAFFDYWFNFGVQNAEFNKKVTEYKLELRNGIPAGATASIAPVAPTFGAAPTAVTPGIFVRATSLAGIIKKRINYTAADGKDLGIEGVEIIGAAHRSESDIKPIISVRLVQGGKPEIVWTKDDFDGIDIYVDRGDGTFKFLGTDTVPNFIDTGALPATGASLWKYKAIYRVDDAQIGQWSDVVSVAVGV